ncbi:MAG: bifunctional helix-turn-helix transcriptional regulator/GNAT family N-acetyltransferase [Methyloligella sp. ZOD6]
MGAVETVRDFNRFYTRKIRLLDAHMPASDLPLPEARVIYELAKAGECTAAEIGRLLDMDKAHLSRVLARLRGRGLVAMRPDPSHGKQRLLSLTQAGRKTFHQLDRGSQRQIEALLAPLDEDVKGKLISAMTAIKQGLGAAPAAADAVELRGLEAGDMSWIVHRQARLYGDEYGWDGSYETVAMEIGCRFLCRFDPGRDGAWVAEANGRIVGSVFLEHSDTPKIAQLRLLYVEPEMRGRGIGNRLVQACIDRARALGYRQIKLWTKHVLSPAHRIYEAAGFRLAEEFPEPAFGQELKGQLWVLDLKPAA